MKIKYDKRIKKILVISICVSFLFFLVGVTVMLFEIPGLEILYLFGILVGGGVFLCSVFNLVALFFYFRRLKKHGYEIPHDRKAYQNDLRNVPVSVHLEHTGGLTPDSRESVILAALHLAVFIFANLWNIYYITSWYQYVDDIAVFLLCVQIIFDAGWLGASIIYFKQRSSKKYRDDVEPDFSRKERTSLEKGVFTCLVILVFMVFAKSLIMNMSSYVFRARQEKDQSTIEEIQKCISVVLFENSQDASVMLKDCESYAQMVEGCYISEWSNPQDSFATEIAKQIGIPDYSQLAGRFYTADGNAQIYVRITGSQVYVCMKNPLLEKHGKQPTYEAGK